MQKKELSGKKGQQYRQKKQELSGEKKEQQYRQSSDNHQVPWGSQNNPTIKLETSSHLIKLGDALSIQAAGIDIDAII